MHVSILSGQNTLTNMRSCCKHECMQTKHAFCLPTKHISKNKTRECFVFGVISRGYCTLRLYRMLLLWTLDFMFNNYCKYTMLWTSATRYYSFVDPRTYNITTTASYFAKVTKNEPDEVEGLEALFYTVYNSGLPPSCRVMSHFLHGEKDKYMNEDDRASCLSSNEMV